jgi:hypothetical protein
METIGEEGGNDEGLSEEKLFLATKWVAVSIPSGRSKQHGL